jgi:hypothetical protein
VVGLILEIGICIELEFVCMSLYHSFPIVHCIMIANCNNFSAMTICKCYNRLVVSEFS